jgi:hypothetical protein
MTDFSQRGVCMHAGWRCHFSFPAIAAGLLFAPWIFSGCMGTVKEAAKQALQLETAMHEQMVRGDFAGIYNGADQQYRSAIDRGKSDALFSSIARKLGSPLGCKQGNTFVQATT